MWTLILSVLINVAGIVFLATHMVFVSEENWDAIIILFKALGLLVMLFLTYNACAMLYFIYRYISGKEQYDITDEHLIIGGAKIEWNDIKGFKIITSFKTDHISVELENPEKYIKKYSSIMSKRVVNSNVKRTGGSPFIIYALSKGLTSEDILKNLEYELGKHKH